MGCGGSIASIGPVMLQFNHRSMTKSTMARIRKVIILLAQNVALGLVHAITAGFAECDGQ